MLKITAWRREALWVVVAWLASTAIPSYAGERIFANGFEEITTAGCSAQPLDTDADCLLDNNQITAFTPPDPVTVASPLDPTVVTDFAEANRFIYAGANPIQRGVATGVIQNYRAAVLRGKVLDAAQQPLPGVLVRVLGHPEYGYTYTRADGVYDLVVNGGGDIYVDYRKNGYLRAQRSARTPWKNWKWLPATTLIALDSAVTATSFNATTALQVHRATLQTDSDGSRQATLMIPAGTRAQLRKADGSLQEVSTLHIRATEYTVGAQGRERMPAPLPASSGYTYAVELSADEAVTADARSVVFDRPLALYFENYRGFPVGASVPVGYYDFRLGSWLPSADGRVIKIVGNTGGFATLDVDGKGQAATPAVLAALGISDAERAKLMLLYSVGQTLWRSPIPHFTPWDCNFPFGLPPDSDPPSPPPDPPSPNDGSGPDPDAPDPNDPNPPPPGGDDQPPKPDSDNHKDPDPDRRCGSIIDCNNAQLGELVPITGTPYTLSYRSDRLPGANVKTSLRVRVPITGATVPAGVKRINVEVCLAGNCHTTVLDPPQANYVDTFDWDGKDYAGRLWQGPLKADVKIGYVYNAVYYESNEDRIRSFDSVSGYPVTRNWVINNTWEITVTAQWSSDASVRGRPLLSGYWNAQGLGVGGWSLSAHHVFDPVSRTLYFGDGRFKQVGQIASNAIAALEPYSTAAWSTGGSDVAGPDGTMYRLRRGNGEGGNREVIYRLRPGQTTAEQVAENCPMGNSEEDCVDTTFLLWGAGYQLIIDEQGGVLLIADDGIYRFAGPQWQPTRVFDPAALDTPCTMEGPSWQFEKRTYFICTNPDDSSSRIFMLWPNGEVSWVLGGGTRTDATAPAADVVLNYGIRQIAISAQGDLYFSEPGLHRIRRLDTRGLVTVVAGTGTAGDVVEGHSAKQSPIQGADALAISRDGTLLFADSGKIIEIAKNGQFHILLGGGNEALSVSGTNIGRRVYIGTNYLDALPDGSLVFDTGNGLMRWSHSSFRFDSEGENFRIPSDDGSEVYVFDPKGRHLQTLNAMTGVAKHTFAYDATGYLIRISDGDGNATTLERDANHRAQAIVSPYGVRTTLQLDGNGYLQQISAPNARQWSMTYTPGFPGLLKTFTQPRGYSSTLEWSLMGNLSKDSNAVGGYQSLERTQWNPQSAIQSSITTATGRSSDHETHEYPDGSYYKSTRSANGTQRHTVITNAYVEAEDTNGVHTVRRYDPEPRFGLEAALLSHTQTNLKSSTFGLPDLQQNVAFARSATPIVANADLGQLDIDEQVDINNRSYLRHYDAASRLWSMSTPEGRIRSVTLDSQARPTHVAVPGLAIVDYSYDARGRLTQVASGSGAERREWNYGYDAHGYLSSIQDPLSRSVSLTNDDSGRPTQQQLPDTRTIGFVYDANNNLTEITPPGRSAHRFTYNPVDRLTAYQPPSLAAGSTNTAYTDNLDSQLEHSDDADGRRVALDYYTGSVVPATLTTPEGTRTMGYSYGQLQSITATDAVNLSFITYGDRLPARHTWQGAVAGSVDYRYDTANASHSNFWLTELQLGGLPTSQGVTRYGYDQDGLLTQANHISAANPPVITSLSLTRDPQNGLLTGTAMGSLTDTWSYNPFAEPTGYTARYNNNALYSTNYQRDKLGRITQITETLAGQPHITDYGYDLAGRLHTVMVDGTLAATYGYDSNSNRTSLVTPNGMVTATYDAQDRMSQYGGETFTYNNSGQLTQRTLTATGAQTRYQYDTLGNLRRVTLPNGTVIDYVIDALNRRVGKKVNGTLTQGLLYLNQLKPIAELDAQGDVVSTFIYADRSNVPSYLIKAGKSYRLIADHLGSPRVIVDSATGAIVQQLDYDAFGNITNDTNPGFQPFGFAGGLYDKDTGLVRFGARDYDSTTGRWTAKDPIRFEGGDTNLFSYAGNDPVNLIDPSGLDWIYSQSTGQMTHVDANGNSTNVGTGYAGHGAGYNNPANQGVPGTGPNSDGGPLPQGTYDIGPGHYSPHTGPNTMNLTPQPGTDTLGRDLFRIHGDNALRNNSASQGCIVADPNIRNQINNSSDRVLRVVP